MMREGSQVTLIEFFLRGGGQITSGVFVRKLKTAIPALLFGLPQIGYAFAPIWKEEVILADGAKVVVERSIIVGSTQDIERRSAEYGPPQRGSILRVPLPNGGWTTTWEAIGLDPQALGRVGETYYLSATTMRCDDYDKWGRPVPPYVFFVYYGNAWRRISVDDFPSSITKRNLTYWSSATQRAIAESRYLSAEQTPSLSVGLSDRHNSISRAGIKGVEGCWEDFRLQEAAKKMRQDREQRAK